MDEERAPSRLREFIDDNLNWFIYGPVIVIVSAVVIVAILAIAKPRIAAAEKLDVIFVGVMTDASAMSAAQREAAADFDELKAIVFRHQVLTDKDDTTEGMARLSMLMISGDGDVFIMPRAVYEQLAVQDAFLALDGYLDGGSCPEAADHASEALRIAATFYEEDPDAEPLLYGLPADELAALRSWGYDPRDCVVSVAGYCANPEDAVRMVDWLFGHLDGAK